MNTKNKNRIQNGLIQRKKTLYHISMFSAQESSYRIRIKPQMKKKFPAKEFIWGLGKLFVARKRRIFSHVNTKKGRKRKKNQLELLPSNKIKQDSQLEWKYKTPYIIMNQLRRSIPYKQDKATLLPEQRKWPNRRNMRQAKTLSSISNAFFFFFLLSFNGASSSIIKFCFSTWFETEKSEAKIS